MRRSGREVDLEEMIEKQQDSIIQLTKEKEGLKQKVKLHLKFGLSKHDLVRLIE